jgi:hypothetical protein
VDQIGQMRAASELLAQRTMERVLDLVVQSLDVNELAQQVDVNELLSQLDLNAVIGKIDLNALLSRVNIQAVVDRVDVDAIIQHTDIGAAVAMSSGHVTGKAVDILRGQAITLDDRIDHWVRRLLRRSGPGLAGPPALLNTGAGA